MYRLKIDHDLCTLCSTCEMIFPELLTKARGEGLLISDSRLKEHTRKIWQAIFSCQGKALYLEKING